MNEEVVKDCSLNADAACTRGHFPGHPMAPGAYLLARVAQLLAEDCADRRLAELRKVKFVRPLVPGQRAELRYRLEENAGVRFSITDANGTILEGSGLLRPLGC